jgi:octaprenyl-diphosphate synthase
MHSAHLYPRLDDLLAEVEAGLRRVWEGERRFLGLAARRALSGRGKRLRPALLLLAAECCGGAEESSTALATAVEVLHTASLVHDDVVDDSTARRGRRSANALWGNKLSVLLGDYLVAQAFQMLPVADRDEWLSQLVGVAERMCEGQVRELRAAGRRLSERAYLEIVREKTGALFGFCGRAGAQTAGAPPRLVSVLGEFGERFGIAFQFADDILDLVGSNGQSGKPEGRDLAERKFTLPLIMAAAADRNAARTLEAMVRSGDATEQALREARDIAQATLALDAAWRRVAEWLEAARERLHELPPSDARDALFAMAGERFPLPMMTARSRER